MTAGRIWAASIASIAFAILAVYALHSLVAFFVIVAVTLWLAGVVCGLAAVGAWADERKRAEDAEGRADDLTDELVSAVAMAESLADELSHADRTIRNLAAQVAAKAEKPDLHIVPPQRSDSWLEQVMDEQAALGAEQSGDAS